MAGRQEKGDERIGNTVEPFDEPAGHFRRNPQGRGAFGRPVRRRSRPYSPVRPSIGSCRTGQNRQRRGHGIIVDWS